MAIHSTSDQWHAPCDVLQASQIYALRKMLIVALLGERSDEENIFWGGYRPSASARRY